MSTFYPSFDLFDPNAMPALDEATVDRIIASPERTASDLLVLYFASLLSDLEGARGDAVNDRIVNTLADMAADGDTDAAMAMMALEEISTEDGAPETKAVAIAMFEQVALKPILQAAINGELDFAKAAAGIGAVKGFAELLLEDFFGTDDPVVERTPSRIFSPFDDEDDDIPAL